MLGWLGFSAGNMQIGLENMQMEILEEYLEGCFFFMDFYWEGRG